MVAQVDNVHQSPDPDTDVFEALHALTHLYLARLMPALREAPQPLTILEAKVLGFFARQPGASQTDLVEHSGRDKSQIAKLIAGLRQRGLLEARPDANDRRVLTLQLTAQGRKLHTRLLARRRRLDSAAAQGLSQQERAQMVALVTKLRAHLQQMG